ncbi:exonuclease III [Streptomyces sp. ADI96-15]|uniref:endonuclease/exonuclease/phosphatase n=1 Tax=Streptomyces sp. ADI96-15 TaxID=1522761 RepID=UPI000FB6158A|nr:endonuclease/exonuclease/phosphatase [Streptomyces sp. ADI96-15]RPK58340.1 exonuclease III [Streptomyces sp. ADI96-15]
MTSLGTLDVLTFNLNNPGRERAERQLAYLAARPEQVLVLTETANSAGCDLLERRFTAAGYSVTFPRPELRGERGVMVVSRLEARPLSTGVDFLAHRAVGIQVDTETGPLDIIGLYVPSRDATEKKTERKRNFLQECRKLPDGGDADRVVLGDFNVLEPGHVPRYRFFSPFEYEFYSWFEAAGYVDAFRHLHPDTLDYSWVGRTGDGYRYDHVHVSGPLAGALRHCSYVHEPRTMPDRLTDHSALGVRLAVSAAAPLPVTDPTQAVEPLAALF